MHDGAVIVQRDRIAAAACFLPLSMNPVLSTQLGTRHRAGIGITEETDAVAVIISEETGTISMAVAGSIERELTVERLRERLSALLRRYAPAPTLPSPVEESFVEEEPPSSQLSRRRMPGGTTDDAATFCSAAFSTAFSFTILDSNWFPCCSPSACGWWWRTIPSPKSK